VSSNKSSFSSSFSSDKTDKRSSSRPLHLPRHRVMVCVLSGDDLAKRSTALRGWVGVHLSLAAGHGDVDEAASVCDSLLRAALGRLLLLLWLDLWSLRLDLSGTCERAVHLTHVGGCGCG